MNPVNSTKQRNRKASSRLGSFQTTLKRSVSLSGVGLHTGATINMSLHPAPAGHGVSFIRTDLRERPVIRADISSVVRTDMCTTLGLPQNLNASATVSTVEHLMAAVRGLGLDNALIEVSGPEVPIMDGSALVFAAAIADAGIRVLDAPRKVLRLKGAVRVAYQDKWIEARPSLSGLSITGTIDFKHRVIGCQAFTFDKETDFLSEIAAARTFGFLKEVEYLRHKGLALGGSLANAVVLDENTVLNEEGLRFADEFVRHKVLDAFGDFALMGIALEADVHLHKSGHELHAGLLNKIISEPENYEIVELTAPSVAAEEKQAPNMGFGLGIAVPA
jgi:UDP-3-O-[3-hydroxymyristoyl] N-acetylglucosamine deacetylase